MHAAVAMCSRALERDADAHLQSLMREHRAARTGDIERDIPLSWTAVLLALFSYTLLLSDVLRTGMAIRGSVYAKLEPNHVISFGPYAYPVVHILYNETAASVNDIWAYKYDSTSTGMRAVAEHLRIEQWPPCVLYKTRCETRSIKFSTIFDMLDSLVAAVAQHKSTRMPINLTLRTRSAWIDRIHHFILPWFFSSFMTRTSQAIYYDAHTLSSADFQFCSANRVRPYACTDFWTHFTPICYASNPLCQDIGQVLQHAMARYRSLQQRYIGMTLDLVVLEGQDDPSKASLSFQGRKWLDIVVITRVRDCSASSGCFTVAVDDYRYESASLMSSAEDSYFLIAILRCLGQTYAWLRVTLLVIGCYAARSAEPKFATTSVSKRISVALRTVLLVPSQVVTYGSVFPIVCYVTAHTLDSATVYELVAQKFNSPLGVFQLNPEEFVQFSAVSMRSVWVLAFLLHVVLYVRTRHQWSQARGIPGVPELSISFVASLTIMAQFRSIYFRDSRVLSIAEVVPSSRMAVIRAYGYDNALGVWGLIVRGNTLDTKCLIAAVATYIVIFVVIWSFLSVLNLLHPTKRFILFAMPRTRVPFTASTLWSVNALVISWNGLQLRRSGGASQTAIVRQYAQLREKKRTMPKSLSFLRQRVTRVSPVQMQEVGHLLRREFARLDERSGEVESIVYLMNLTVLTDPVALMWLWWLRSARVCVFRSLASRRMFLVPQEAVNSPHDVPVVWSDYELLMIVSTTDLAWQDLLHCG